MTSSGVIPEHWPSGQSSPSSQRTGTRRVWSSVRRVTLTSSDVAAIRGAEKALAEAFEASDPTAWVGYYTDDAIFVGPGMPAIEGRDALLSAAPSVVISSMEIVADSTLGAGTSQRRKDGRAGRMGRRARMPHRYGGASSWSGAVTPTGAGASRVSCSTRTCNCLRRRRRSSDFPARSPPVRRLPGVRPHGTDGGV